MRALVLLAAIACKSIPATPDGTGEHPVTSEDAGFFNESSPCAWMPYPDSPRYFELLDAGTDPSAICPWIPRPK